MARVLESVKTFDGIAKYTPKQGPMLQSNEHLIAVTMEENEYLKGMVYEDVLTGAVTFHEDWLEKRAGIKGAKHPTESPTENPADAASEAVE